MDQKAKFSILNLKSSEKKFTNCIYFLSHSVAYNIILQNDETMQANKIGSSKCLPQRMVSYKTYYPIDKIVEGYFYIYDYDCYDLDDDIKIQL
jgi:hypothetical protein